MLLSFAPGVWFDINYWEISKKYFADCQLLLKNNMLNTMTFVNPF